MKRIHMLLAASALLAIVGCGGNVVDNTNNANGKPSEIVPPLAETPSPTSDTLSPAVETPSPAVESAGEAEAQPAINVPLNAPEQTPKAVEAAPAAPAAPPAVVTEEGESRGSVFDSLGKALRRGIIAVPDERENE